MASIFLVNDNKIVSRLLQLSSEKHGYLLEEKTVPEPSRDHYDILLIDSDSYTPELVETLRAKTAFDKIGYIGTKHEEVPPEFDMHLDKPFLPSDFVTMINTHTTSLQSAATEAPQPDTEEKKVLSEELDFEEETLSLDIEAESPASEATPEIDTLLEETPQTGEGMEALDELEELETLENMEELDDLDLDDLTPEHAEETALQPEEEIETGLKDLDKTEDALKELEALDEEMEDVDLSLDASAVMSTGIAEQFVEESEQEQQPSLHEIEEQAEAGSQQEADRDISAAALAAGAGLAAAAAAMTNGGKEETETEEESGLSALDNLEGAEDIEHESDYIEEKLTVDDLAQEFDTLNEAEVLKALNPDAEIAESVTETATQQAVEEIVHEEIVTEGEETMVESNDVEQWIRDAVAKAITPEMIQEALQNMEVTIRLDFKKRDNG